MKPQEKGDRIDRFSQVIGQSRFVVLLAVAAVMLVAVSLFLLGAMRAAIGVWDAWQALFYGRLQTVELSIQFLEIVSVMLKAVVFYLIGVGLYSLFVSPLNITVSLGVQTLADLESKVVSVVIVILAVTFLEHFVAWRDPLATLQFGVAMGVAIIALVLFQRYSHLSKENQHSRNPNEHVKAQKKMFEYRDEQADIEVKEPSADDGENEA